MNTRVRTGGESEYVGRDPEGGFWLEDRVSRQCEVESELSTATDYTGPWKPHESVWTLS